MHAKLAHLSIAQVTELITRYYKGEEKIQDLISEYAIDVRPSGLVGLFPPVVHDDLLCAYCPDTKLQSKRESRTGYSFIRPACPKCKHENKISCWCSNCQKESNLRRQTEGERKRELIVAAHGGKNQAVPLEELTLKDALYLVSLSRHSLSEDLKYVDPYSDEIRPDLAPPKLLSEIVSHLYRRRLIGVDIDSRIDAFTFDDKVTHTPSFYLAKVNWIFLPGLDMHEKIAYLRSLEDMAKSSWKPSWLDSSNEEWRLISKHECLEYFQFLLSQRGYELDEIGEKTHAVFDSLLADYSVAQIFSLTWQAVRDTTDYIVKNNLPKYHGKNIFIGAVQRKADKFRAEGWEARNARRDFECPQTVVSATFFNLFLQLGNAAFETVVPRLPPPPIANAS